MILVVKGRIFKIYFVAVEPVSLSVGVKNGPLIKALVLCLNCVFMLNLTPLQSYRLSVFEFINFQDIITSI